MGRKNSSFHMGDEFNGSGKKTYLKATKHKAYAPLSQNDVKLTPDFGQCVPKALGAVPLLVNPSSEDSNVARKALGSMPGMSQVILAKDAETGKYQMSFAVRKIQLTTGSYLHQSQKQKGRSKSVQQFVAETVGRFMK